MLQGSHFNVGYGGGGLRNGSREGGEMCDVEGKSYPDPQGRTLYFLGLIMIIISDLVTTITIP